MPSPPVARSTGGQEPAKKLDVAVTSSAARPRHHRLEISAPDGCSLSVAHEVVVRRHHWVCWHSPLTKTLPWLQPHGSATDCGCDRNFLTFERFEGTASAGRGRRNPCPWPYQERQRSRCSRGEGHTEGLLQRRFRLIRLGRRRLDRSMRRPCTPPTTSSSCAPLRRPRPLVLRLLSLQPMRGLRPIPVEPQLHLCRMR